MLKAGTFNEMRRNFAQQGEIINFPKQRENIAFLRN